MPPVRDGLPLAETNVSGSKGIARIARDLPALRTQLEKPEPDSV
ncbi:MAG: hypothetical protein SFW67_31660 [Myxococcaceae bacterium]|nr:hypothetical protein [Myxococcaceae bacterium]